jgi:hypothetical protein
MARALAVLAAVASGAAAPPGVPDLVFEAPASLSGVARRLERADAARVRAVVRLVGFDSAGEPIRVVLAPEDSDVAKETPASIAGFATSDEVVLFPGRTTSYPHESLEEVLQHEVAHVLIWRAAGHRPVPRWFHEGVARLAERTWSLGERTRYAYEIGAGPAVPPRELDALFRGGGGDVERAYSLSALFVQDLVERHGGDVPARVLRAMRDGADFEAAFASATGVTVTEASTAFWRSNRLWLTWVPRLTAPETLYVAMALLALLAIWRARVRRVARRTALEEAEADTDGPDGDGLPGS